jgi:SNF2 family DNA or RNA helicase
MKIKPRLKTHWLASQNPMMVSLDHLKYVVFNPPQAFIDSGFSFESLEKIPLSLKSEVRYSSPDHAELQDVMSRSHTLSRDLFWTLFSGYELLTMKSQALALRELAQSLEFHYENGESYSLVSLYRKPGLPPFLNPQFYLQDRGCHWERVLLEDADQLMKPLKIMSHQKKHEDFKKAWIVILEILAWAFQRKRQIGDLAVLWTTPGADNIDRVGYSLSDIEFVKGRPLAATLMAETHIKNAARLTVWQGTEKENLNGVLKLYSVSSIYDEASQTELSDIHAEEMSAVQKNSNLNWTRLFATSLFEAPQILKSIEHLKQNITTENIHFVNHYELSGADFKPQLKLREFDGSIKMAVSFKMNHTELVLLNFPHSVHKILGPFFGGLETFLGFDRKDLASKQAQYRQNDLLILRHQGMALFCLLDLINWKLNRPLTSGEVIQYVADQESPEFDRQFQKMMTYFKGSIPGLLGKTNEKFDFLFSAEVRGYFLDFVEKLYLSIENDLNLFFQSKQIFEIKNVHEQVLILMRFLILHLVEESGGKVLMKSQSTIGEQFKQSLLGWTQPQIISDELYEKGFEALWVDIGLSNRGLIHLLFDLIDHQVDVEMNGVPFLSKDNPFEFVFNMKSSENKDDVNWFDLHPQIFFNGQRISSEEVQLNFTPDQIGFIEYQGQIYRIDKKQVPSMKALQKFWERIKGEKNKVTRNLFGDKVFRLEKSVALELLMLKAQGIQVQAEGEWKRIFEYFENGLGIEKITLPDVIQKSLLPHQLEGAQWLKDLYELRLGAILADEMGLGKTFQVLAFLESQRLINTLGHSLIVVPTSLVYNWLDEKKKFSPDLPVEIFQSADKEKIKTLLTQQPNKVVIATYGLLNENCDFFENFNWNIVVFDEAQNLKNITSVRSVSARKLQARFKVCLTGTPMENNYLEFYSLCDLVVPGCLGEIDEFRRNYFNNEVRNESLQKLRLITKPLLLRRTKTQVKLNLPIKTVQEVVLPFPEKQKEIYKKMALSFSRQVDDLIQQSGENKAQIAMFAALMRLRQICSDPAAVPGVDFKEKPVKVQHFLTSLQEHLENGESVIVFTQFLSTLNRIETELKKAEVNFYTLQGKISSKERIKLISAFQQTAEPSVMLMTLKTGGVGLNLTKASVVYHLEPWWNPAVENQATDRAHRMGQTKDVKVYNLLIEGSLEERISELKVKKQSSFDRLFSVDEQIEDASFESSQSLSREDFLFLLKS